MGKSYAHPLVVMITLPNELDQVRIGVAAGRSIGGAVERNRAKRILKAAIQSLISNIAAGTDILLLARRPIKKTRSVELKPVLEKLMNEAMVIINER